VTASKHRRVAISGYYGCGNAGDEAVLAGIRDSFARLAGDRVALTALSQHPEETYALHGIEAANRLDLRTLKSVIGSSNLLISGGGSLLQDTTSLKSLLYYLYVMRIAIAQKIPLMMYAQGIGPLKRRISRTLVRMTANHAAHITVRDSASAELLRSIGVKRPAIDVTADPAFALDSAPDAIVSQLLGRNGLGGITATSGGHIAVALRPWGERSPALLKKYCELLSAIEKRTGRECILLPMHHPDDLNFADALNNEMGGRFKILRENCGPEIVLGIVARMDCVVAMRLHTLIFAARGCVPAFALAYDPKVTQLMRGLEAQDFTADWRDFDIAAVVPGVERLLQQRQMHSETLEARSLEREQAALKSCEIALQIMGLS